MTTPAAPNWLLPEDVARWLGNTGVLADMALLSQCAAAVEAQVEAARPDMWAADTDPEDIPVYAPDAEVYTAGVMLAARLFRRRNSPAGIEGFADSVIYVGRYDPEIERALRQGHWRRVRVG